MEFNAQNSSKSQQIGWSSDDLGGPGQVRSYSCTFCKRGFSNAQALGGHMNIHRRDRAKLKQSSEENLLSLDISMKSTEHLDSEENLAPQKGKLVSATTAEHPRNPSYVAKATGSSVVVQSSEEEKTDLDLELRLGFEPLGSSILSTRAFF